nr:hypothetical protein CFP56_35656 [Quercus suber]
MSLQSMSSGRIASSFSDMRISGGGGGDFGSGSGFGFSTGIESFSTKSKATAPQKGLDMQLGKTFYI